MSDILKVDTRFLDVDFGEEAKQKGFATGANPRQEPIGSLRSPIKYAAGFPTYTWQQLKDHFTNRIPLKKRDGQKKNQKQEGSCVGNAGTSAVQNILVGQVGIEKDVWLSAISVYRLCGRSPGSGTSIECVVNKLKSVGAIPSDKTPGKERFKVVHPDTGYYIDPPAGWQNEAAYFKIHEDFDIETPLEFATALAIGWPIIYARASHCILAEDLVFEDSVEKPTLSYLNSWDESWGDGGYGYDSYRTWSNACYGAVAVKSVTIHPALYLD